MKFLSMAGPVARLSAVLLLGTAALPDVAAAQGGQDMYQTSGVLGIFGAYATANGDGDGGDSWLLGGDARANVWLTPGVSTQFDFHGETGQFDQDGDDTESRSNVTVGGHLTWRDPAMYALGIFGGVTNGTILDDVGDESRYFVGLEGQYYLDAITLYGQVGFSDILQGDDNHAEMTDAWFARGVGRWFVTPNDKVEGEFGYYHSEDIVTGGQGPVTNFNWGALYEHRYADSMFSSYIEYDGHKRADDSHSDSGVTEHIFMIGARINLNQPDLKTADRYGATLDLPDVIRTENWADITH